MTRIPKTPISPEAYLEIERKAEFKSEFHDGEVYAMSGGTYRHSRLKTRLTALFELALRGKPCRPTDSDMRVHIPELGNFTYPDLSIVCGKPEFLDAKQDTLTNPTVLFEVLSESTAAFDRGKKFFYYRHLSSLQDYLLVSQDEPLIEHYSRQPNGGWLFTTVEAGQILHLASLDCSIAVDEIYHDIDPT
jgi:Uma2 family endonuclease